MSNSRFANGLARIVPSQGDNDPSADNASVAVTKINSNFERSLALGGTWIGAGLRWVNNTLVLNNGTNQVIVGDRAYTLSNEFIASGGVLALANIPIGKIAGTLSAELIALTNGSVLVGGNLGQGRALALDLNTFSVGTDTLSLRQVPASAYVKNTIAPSKLNLPPNNIPVGSSTLGAGAVAVALGSMFTIEAGVLKVITSSTVTYENIGTIDSFKGLTPRLLVTSLDSANKNVMSWLDLGKTINDIYDNRVASSISTRSIYVDSETGNDAIANRGLSKNSPFKTIARAALEVARVSYTPSGDNTFSRSTIYVSSGQHQIDNRPGGPVATTTTTAGLTDLITNGNLNYFNSESGGVILPRGCSLIGTDLRKTGLVPIYIPVDTLPTAILRLTGSCYVTQVGFKDNPLVLRSHHLVNAFEFASAVDLTLYYKKVYAAFKDADALITNNLIPNTLETEIVAKATAGQNDINGFATVDSTIGASPYIFQVSIRSRFGMCGAYFDGAKVSGFKSAIASQFTCVSMQVDPLAYNLDSSDVLESKNYKDGYQHYGFTVANNAYAQLVSCFVIGSAVHYVSDSGGELSISNSTSDFGGISLYSRGSSELPLVQDTALAAVRILPPQKIVPDIRELVVALLNPMSISTNLIGATQIYPVAPLKFINGSYIYVRVPHPVVAGTYLVLQAKLVSTGDTAVIGNDGTANIARTESYFNVLDVVLPASASDVAKLQNQINAYIYCIGDFRFENTWYNAANPPVGGLAAAEITETTRRKNALLGTNVFVTRIFERRTVEQRNYHFLVSVPASSRVPSLNYLLDHPLFKAIDHRYYIAQVKQIQASDLAGDTSCASIPGTVYQVTILRANRPDTKTGSLASIGDLPEDLNLTESYTALLSNLEPRVYVGSLLDMASVDVTSVSYITTVRLLTDLGYTVDQVALLVAPTAAGTLVERYRCLTLLDPTVLNSSFSFNLTKPSLIRCTNHTWEWVGYRNYHSSLPKFQFNLLPIGKRLAALQTIALGGQIYATGMDEIGNLYQGRNVLSLATNTSQTIRFDGLQEEPANLASASTFVDLTVLGTLRAANAIVQNATINLLEFQPASTLALNRDGHLLPLTEANTPEGLKANSSSSTYGLVRRCTALELNTRSGAGYVAPADLLGIDAALAVIANRSTTSTTSTPPQSLASISLSNYQGGATINWNTDLGGIPSGWRFGTLVGGMAPLSYWQSSSNMFNFGQQGFGDTRLCHSIMVDRDTPYTRFELTFSMVATESGNYRFQLASVANGAADINNNLIFPEAGHRNDFATLYFTQGQRIDGHIIQHRYDNFEFFLAWETPTLPMHILGYPEIQTQGGVPYTIIKN